MRWPPSVIVTPIMEADNAFHEAIVMHSGNPWLSRFWQNMNLPMTTIVTVTLSTRSLPELADRHTPILETLARGDAVAAEAAMRQHIEEIGGWVLAALETPDDSSHGTLRNGRGGGRVSGHRAGIRAAASDEVTREGEPGSGREQ